MLWLILALAGIWLAYLAARSGAAEGTRDALRERDEADRRRDRPPGEFRYPEA
jgi:hypothetical protein